MTINCTCMPTVQTFMESRHILHLHRRRTHGRLLNGATVVTPPFPLCLDATSSATLLRNGRRTAFRLYQLFLLANLKVRLIKVS
jgi:hypothetical protein